MEGFLIECSRSGEKKQSLIGSLILFCFPVAKLAWERGNSAMKQL